MKQALLTLAVFGFIFPLTVGAQLPDINQFDLGNFGLPDVGNTGQIDMSNIDLEQIANINQDFSLATLPHFPEPNSEVEVSLEAYSIDTTGASISWYIDDVEQPQFANLRKITYTTKEVGETTKITADLGMRIGQVMSRSITVVPSRIELIMEADTITPDFYKGRAMPSVGSIVRIIAIPNNGSGARPESFSYVWKHDNKILFGGPVTGKHVAEIEMNINNNQLITVDAIDAGGRPVARKSIYVPLTKPEVLFYEDNPLRGAGEIALESPYILADEEVTLRAEPFYMNRDIFVSEHVLEWKINGSSIANPGTDPQYITLRRQAGIGIANLEFHVRNLSQLLQGVTGTLGISF